MKYDDRDITNAHLAWYRRKMKDFTLKKYKNAIFQGELDGDLLCLQIISDTLRVKVL